MDITRKELFAILIIVLTAYFSVRLIRFLVKRHMRKLYVEEIDTMPLTGLRFFYNTIAFLVYTFAVIAIIYTIPPFRSLGTSLFAGAGILAAIIGFASQQAFSNIIGGIFIVIFKPFRIGDIIKVGSINEGHVEDITLRHTVIKDYDNRRIVVPNAIINNETIYNATIGEERICNRIPFGISYDADLAKAEKIIREHAKKHPLCKDYRTKDDLNKGMELVEIRLIEWADSSVILRAYVWTANQPEGFILKTDLYRSVKLAFDEQGIEIPYPHRTLVYKNHAQEQEKENKQETV